MCHGTVAVCVMVITDKIVLRQLAAREWRRPEDGLARAQLCRLFSEMAPEIGGSRSWRKEPFKKYFEDFQAALFAYGIKQPAPDYEWQYSYGELDGYNREPCEEIRQKLGVLMFEFSRFWPSDYEHGRDFVADLDAFLGKLPKSTHHQVTGEPMKFLSLADWTGIVETELFAPAYRSYGLATVRYPVLEIEARVEPFENGRGYSLRALRAGKPRTHF
jgi:hypothetical protein